MVFQTDTVADVKKRIQTMEGIPTVGQKLYMNGKDLSNTDKIANFVKDKD